jgi:NAD(P)H-quinone oxidoreductase subunit 4L
MADQFFKSQIFKDVLYSGIVFIAVCSFLGLIGNTATADMVVNNLVDLYIFIGIILGGLAFLNWGARSSTVIASGAIGSFVVLTATQDILVKYLTLSALLFAIGMYGMVRSRNAVRVLMSIELMLNAVNINLIAFARYIDPSQVKGQLFAIFILTVAAAEAAVGLAIVLAVYRNMSTIDMNKFNLLKW